VRRTLLLFLAAGLVLTVVFLVYFTTSRYYVSKQPYLRSLADFLFMVGSYRDVAFGRPPALLTDESYQAAMSRFGRHTHSEVERRAVWTVARWGSPVVPRLATELDEEPGSSRQDGALRVLAAIDDPTTVAPIVALVERLLGVPTPDPGDADARPLRRRLRAAVTALGDKRSPAAAAPLLRLARLDPDGDRIDAVTRNEALAGTGGGVEFLLTELDRSDDPEQVHSLLWALAATRDPAVARRLAPLLRHRRYAVRSRTRDAMDQSMGPVAVDPVLDLIAHESDEHVISNVVRELLDDPDALDNRRVVPTLAGYLEHPALRRDAAYALARLGSDDAIAALEADAARTGTCEHLDQIEMMGDGGLGLVEGCLGSDGASDRGRALGAALTLYTPVVRPWVASLASDPDANVAGEARAVLWKLDEIDLHASFAASLPERVGRGAWNGFRPHPVFGWDSSIVEMWRLLRAVHVAATVMAVVLGLLFLFDAVRLFDPYRFQLFVVFLLAEGVVGNFFFTAGGDDPRSRYIAATGAHLLLLLGFLGQRRHRTPGELHGRFERLGGASLWLLAPSLLWVGAPIYAQALRTALTDFRYMGAWLGLLAVTTLLVVGQWIVPAELLPRRARVERVIAALLVTAVLGLLATALFRHCARLTAAGDGDGAIVTALVGAPLAWLLFLHLNACDLFRRIHRPRRVKAPPDGRLHAIVHGDRHLVRVVPRHRRTLCRRALAALPILVTAIVAGVVAGRDGRAEGLALALAAGLLGAAVSILVLQLVHRPIVIEIRHGWVRSAATFLGGSFGRARWRRVPGFRPGIRSRLASTRPRGGDGPLSPAERTWLAEAVSGGGDAR